VVWLAGLLILAGVLIAGITVLIRSGRGGDAPWPLTDLRFVFRGTTIPLALVAWVIGATSVGADWHTGTMATTLTWESRRVRLHTAKAVATLGFVFVGFVAAQVALGLGLLPAALVSGTTEGADASWLADTAVVVLRGGALAVVAASIGFSVASIFRNTAAGVGIGFAYLNVVETLLGALFPGLIDWLLVPNAIAFMIGENFDVTFQRSAGQAAALLAFYAVAFLVAATLVFRTRDVT
jgi:hypothetical protein